MKTRSNKDIGSLSTGVPRRSPSGKHLPLIITMCLTSIIVRLTSYRRRHHLQPSSRHCIPSNLRYQPLSVYTDLEVLGGLWNCQLAVKKADSISAYASLQTLHFLALTETWITLENTATPAALSTAYSLLHILCTGDFPHVYIGETIADLNKKSKWVHEYTLSFGPCIQLQLLVFIAPLVPTGTLQATTGHSSFSYMVGKGEVRGGVQFVLICDLTARYHSILHIVPLNT